MLCISGMASVLAELLVTAVTCSGDISAYIYVKTVQPGSPMEPVVTTYVGNGNKPIYILLQCSWAYTIVLPAIMSFWLGWVRHVGKRYNRTAGDPVKLGVVLGWVVNTDLPKEMKQNSTMNLKKFNVLTGNRTWAINYTGGEYKLCVDPRTRSEI